MALTPKRPHRRVSTCPDQGFDLSCALPPLIQKMTDDDAKVTKDYTYDQMGHTLAEIRRECVSEWARFPTTKPLIHGTADASFFRWLETAGNEVIDARPAKQPKARFNRANALDEAEVRRIETDRGIVFPAEYREFLKTLGTGANLLDWKNGLEKVRATEEKLRRSCEMAAEWSSQLLPQWRGVSGPPEDEADRKRQVLAAVQAAPRVFPITERHIMFSAASAAAPPCVISLGMSSTPTVFDIQDLQVQGDTFVHFVQYRVLPECGIEFHTINSIDAYCRLREVPFWGRFIN